MSGWLALLSGFAIVVHLGWPVAVRALLALLWIADTGIQLAALCRAQATVRALRLLDDGFCEIRDRDGTVHRCPVLAGTVLTRTFAWLRIRLPSGANYGEWLTAARCGREAWQGLQWAWRWRRALK